MSVEGSAEFASIASNPANIEPVRESIDGVNEVAAQEELKAEAPQAQQAALSMGQTEMPGQQQDTQMISESPMTHVSDPFGNQTRINSGMEPPLQQLDEVAEDNAN